MNDVKFYIAQVTLNEAGRYVKGVDKDIENEFPGLRYSSASGLNDIGENIGIHTENYVDEDKTSLYLSDTPIQKPTKITLKLYFFAPNKSGDENIAYTQAQEVYFAFFEFINGKRLIYHDTARKRYAYMYLSGNTTPSKELLYGVPYIEVTFNFENIYGKTFSSLEDIEL